MTNDFFVLRWEIDQAGIAARRAESPVFDKAGFKWQMKMFEDRGYIVFSTFCNRGINRLWKCDADVDLTLSGNHIRQMKMSFTTGNAEVKWTNQFYNHSIDRNGQYNVNGKVVIEARISIISCEGAETVVSLPVTPSDPSAFSFPGRRSNVVFMIEGKKLHVSKEFLAVHSPVFEAMFFGDYAEKDKEEIELKDVVYEEFIDLLHVIYPSRFRVSEATVRPVLALADRFQMERPLEQAELFLMQWSKFNVGTKLLLADQYRLDQLRDQCVQSFSSAREMRQLKSAPEYAGFSAEMKAALFDRMMHLE